VERRAVRNPDITRIRPTMTLVIAIKNWLQSVAALTILHSITSVLLIAMDSVAANALRLFSMQKMLEKDKVITVARKETTAERKDITAARVEKEERRVERKATILHITASASTTTMMVTIIMSVRKARRVVRKAITVKEEREEKVEKKVTTVARRVERRAENAERVAKREERKDITERAAKEERKDIMKSLSKEEIEIPDVMVWFARLDLNQSLAALPMRYSLTSV